MFVHDFAQFARHIRFDFVFGVDDFVGNLLFEGRCSKEWFFFWLLNVSLLNIELAYFNSIYFKIFVLYKHYCYSIVFNLVGFISIEIGKIQIVT